MAKQKSAAREPMLYITQPNFQKAKPRMQSTYRSVPEKKAEKPQEKEAPQAHEEKPAEAPKKERTRSRERRKQFGLNTPKTEADEFKQPNPFDDQEQETPEEPEAVEEEIVEEELQEEEENKEEERPRVSFTNRKRRERFKDMSLEERVDYFVHLPSSVPRMKCEVITEEKKSYRGWIQDYQDGIVTMKILQRPFRVEIPFESIESIELRGF